MPFHSLRNSESARCPSRDIVAFIDTADSGGNDISGVYAKKLKLLGVKVSKSFGEQVTHLVWSNGSETRVAAAVLMGIIVVNTCWIDKFEECRGKVCDSEHQVVSGIQRTEAAAAVLSLSERPPRLAVSQLRTAKIDSPKAEGHRGRIVAHKTSTARLTDSGHLNTNTADNAEDRDSHSLAYIPLPSFKEHNTGVLPTQLKAHRRSERICDLDEESVIAVEERESLEEVMNIHPDTPLQIHREDCWPPSTSISTSKAKAKSSAERLGCKRMMIQSSVKSSPCTPLALTVPTQCFKENKNTDIKVTVVDWIDNLDGVEGRKTFQNVLDEVDDLVRTCNSICSHSEHSKVKVKKKYKSEGSTGTGTGTGAGGMLMSQVSMTPPAVPVHAPAASTAVHLRAEEDHLGLLCSHLVCPSLSHASVTRSTGLDMRVLFALARGVPIVSTDWIQECSISKSWVDPGPHLCDILKKRKVMKESRTFFIGRRFFVGESQVPSTKVIATLLETLGGTVSDCFSSADTVIIGDNSEIDKWGKIEKERPRKRIKIAAMRFKQHCGGPDSQSAHLKKLDAFFAMMHKNSVLTWKYVCDCVIAGHELRPSCRAGHLVTVATEPAFSKPLIKGKIGKFASGLEPHTRVSSIKSSSTDSPIEENRRQVRPRLTSSSSVLSASDRTGPVHESLSVPACDTLKKYGRLRKSS